MPTRKDRKNNVTAIKLAGWQKVESGSKHSNPRRGRDGMERERGQRSMQMQQVRAEGEYARKSQLKSRSRFADDGSRQPKSVD